MQRPPKKPILRLAVLCTAFAWFNVSRELFAEVHKGWLTIGLEIGLLTAVALLIRKIEKAAEFGFLLLLLWPTGSLLAEMASGPQYPLAFKVTSYCFVGFCWLAVAYDHAAKRKREQST